MMKSVVVCVTTDLVTDNRVRRHCLVLHELGFKVTLVGRELPTSIPLEQLPYQSHRFKLPFHRGPLFYFSYQLWLWFYLWRLKPEIYWSNDLDTVLPCYLVSKFRKRKLVFDAHELFTEVPELENSPIKKKIWHKIEQRFATRADYFITVNNSLAKKFNELYGINPVVIRNVPEKTELPLPHIRTILNIPNNHLILIVQGSGINHGRGLMETLMAIKDVSLTTLLVIGSGDAVAEGKRLTNELDISNRVHFISRLPYSGLMQYTQMADIGLAFDTHPCLNFQLALPNKIFDYFNAGIAVICGDQPEIAKLVETYRCGYQMKTSDVKGIVWAINFYQSNPDVLANHKAMAKKASETEQWENEKSILIALINQLCAKVD